jgi:hypothetical protein
MTIKSSPEITRKWENFHYSGWAIFGGFPVVVPGPCKILKFPKAGGVPVGKREHAC